MEVAAQSIQALSFDGMKPNLAPTNRKLPSQFAWSIVLLAFDFDGTLAPIVPDRDEGRMRRITRGLLKLVAGLYPCIVGSGWARVDSFMKVNQKRSSVPKRRLI